MRRMKLAHSDLEVSAWCLGTMTFGNQTSEEEAHKQMDMALEAGISFWDCAEMYPVAPVKPETVGRSEQILGNWFAKRGRRDEVQLATKVTGPNEGYVRGGKGFAGKNIREAVEGSLRRLQCDHIDIYQLHWPVRGTYHFRNNWDFDPSGQDSAEVQDHMEGVCAALSDVVREGKVRAFGLSNESAWGLMQWNKAARAKGAPEVTTIQNEYSLLDRLYDTDLAETAVHEQTTLLAYSPLAAGLLTGKYQNGRVPEGSRMSLSETLGGRKTERAFKAVAAYLDLAKNHDVDPIHMALAFVSQRPFPSIPIFGATTTEQLQRVLDGRQTQLSADLLKQIDELHKKHPLPF